MGTDDPINLGLAEKSKNLASKLDRFLIFFCQSQLAGSI
jgi:hypothetical protein